MKIGFAQLNSTVGDLDGNFEKIAGAYERLAAAGAELVVAPELAITGYPPQDLPLTFGKRKLGVTICEDIWTERYLPRPLYETEPVCSLVEQGAEVILNLSASPFNLGKPGIRREMIATLARRYGRSICYCNAVGG